MKRNYKGGKYHKNFAYKLKEAPGPKVPLKDFTRT